MQRKMLLINNTGSVGGGGGLGGITLWEITGIFIHLAQNVRQQVNMDGGNRDKSEDNGQIQTVIEWDGSHVQSINKVGGGVNESGWCLL